MQTKHRDAPGATFPRNAKTTGAGGMRTDRSAEERGENEGMVKRDRDPKSASHSQKAGSSNRHSRHLSAESTDLERRVLAHERILQTLIGHMAETEPRFVDRLRETLGDPAQSSRSEHDYVDTDAYAEQFIMQVVRVGALSRPPEARPRTSLGPSERLGDVSPIVPDASRKDSFAVSLRGGVWNVAKNGQFFGDFLSRGDAHNAIGSALPGSTVRGRTAVVSGAGE